MRTFGLLISALILSVSLQASDTGTLEGIVTRPGGAPVSNALVHIVQWRATNINAVLEQRDVRTDGQGRYSVELASGPYDVFISDMALAPIAKKVEIKPGQQTTLSPKMKYDRLAITLE